MLKKSEKPLIHFFLRSQRLINYGLVLTVLNNFGNKKKAECEKNLNEFKCLRERNRRRSRGLIERENVCFHRARLVEVNQKNSFSN